MKDNSLQDLVLGYCQQVGALIDPPAYGIYEVLLPDEVAEKWEIDAHQRFVFAEEGKLESERIQAVLLHYGHPLVETIVSEIRGITANGRFYINSVRLEKPGLFAVIEKALILPNARLFPIHEASQRRRMYHYVCFNFKASLIADEKRELILPIWMHLQGGYPVRPDEIERLATLDTESQYPNLAIAEPLFFPQTNPLSEETLATLMERALQSARRELGDTLQNLQHRLERYLELDRARLNQYYTGLKRDAERRLAKAEEHRRQVLETKISTIENERNAKLADVEQKYRLRIELDLINWVVIAQPKVDLKVEIKKRTASTQRLVIWDPLRHIVEPLFCDVCGLPGDEVHLCENGHLAHLACLALQCVECKRTFCQKCGENVVTCAVCNRPICIHSLVRCPVCQRVTCHDHLTLCHAPNDKPQSVGLAPAAIVETQSAAPEKGISSAPVTHPTEPAAGRKSTSHKEKPTKKNGPTKSLKANIGPSGQYADVYFGSAMPLVSAYVMAKKREIAVRSWELTGEGIAVSCNCEKLFCRTNGLIYRPAPDNQIEAQLMTLIRAFMEEYRVPEKKIHYYRMRAGEPYEVRKLVLLGKWKEAETLHAAHEGFAKLRQHG